MSDRSFKIVDSEIGFSGGRYHTDKSGSPGSAARRAASVLFRMARNEKNDPKWKKFESSKNPIKFTIRESTRASTKKDDEYQYIAKSHKLIGDKVKIIKKGDVEFKVEHEIVVRAAHFVKTPFGGSE
jgi:hypothetical protein